MIVRELLAKFGFQVDTKDIDKWNRSIEKAKTSATTASVKMGGLAKAASSAATGAAQGASKLVTSFAAVPKSIDAATMAAARFKAAQNASFASSLTPGAPVAAPRQNAFLAIAERSRAAMVAAQATATATAAKLDMVFDGVRQDLAIIDHRARALGPSFNSAAAKAELLSSRIHAATALGATMADNRLASLAASYVEAGTELDHMNRRAASGAHAADSAYSILKQTLVGVAVSAAAMFTAFTVGSMIRDYTQWEGALNALKAVSGATATEFEAMREKALKLGVDTVFSTKEATEGMVELARAGMNTKEVMASIDGTLNLAAAGQVSVARAATITSDALNMFALKATDAGRISDLLAAGANASSIGVEQIAESMSYAGAVAHSYGQSVEDITAAIAILGNAGIKGSSAGTGLASMMNRIAAPSSKDAIKYIKLLGLNAKDAHGNMRPLPELLAQVQRGLKGMGNVDRGKAIKEIFGEEAMKDITSFLGMAPDKLKATTEAIHNNRGEAARLSRILNQGLGKAWDELISTLDAFAKRMLLVVAPAIESVIRSITESVKEFGEWADAALKVMRSSGDLAASLKWLRLALALIAPGVLIVALRTLGPLIWSSLVVPLWHAAKAAFLFTAANLGLILLVAGFTLLALVVQDLITWLNGGEAALGDVFDAGYDNGYAFMEWLEGASEQMAKDAVSLWDSVIDAVSNYMLKAADLADMVVDEIQATWNTIISIADDIFSGVYDAIAGWIDKAVGKVGEVVTAIGEAAKGIPGLQTLAESVASGVRAAGSAAGFGPIATPGATVESNAASGAAGGSTSQTNQVSVVVNPPPGATSPAAYGTAAAAGASDGQRRALANGARSLPRPVR